MIDDHFDDLELVSQAGQPSQVPAAGVPPHGLHRCGQNSVGVADRDTDAYRSDVHPEPAAAPRIVVTGPVGLTVVGAHRGQFRSSSVRTAASAESIPAGSLPDPCARSALPPPRPPTAAATVETRSLARTPASWAA